jgi:hypothetical protein
VQRDLEVQAVELLEDAVPGHRQVVADLGPAVEVPPELDGTVQQVPGLLLERVVGHRAW